MKNVFIVVAIPVAIARTVIGVVLMVPIVAVSALLDRLAATLLIKGGFDYRYVDSVREGCCLDLTSLYYNLSRFK